MVEYAENGVAGTWCVIPFESKEALDLFVKRCDEFEIECTAHAKWAHSPELKGKYNKEILNIMYALTLQDVEEADTEEAMADLAIDMAMEESES